MPAPCIVSFTPSRRTTLQAHPAENNPRTIPARTTPCPEQVSKLPSVEACALRRNYPNRRISQSQPSSSAWHGTTQEASTTSELCHNVWCACRPVCTKAESTPHEFPMQRVHMRAPHYQRASPRHTCHVLHGPAGPSQRASWTRSPKTPAAVTSAPAPGPLQHPRLVLR